MWNGGLTELQVTEGYWTAVGAKLLPIVDETFLFDVPTEGANCCYQFFRLIFWALAVQCKPAKRATQRRCAGCLSDD